jgi:hypothetical protein
MRSIRAHNDIRKGMAGNSNINGADQLCWRQNVSEMVTHGEDGEVSDFGVVRLHWAWHLRTTIIGVRTSSNQKRLSLIYVCNLLLEQAGCVVALIRRQKHIECPKLHPG